MPARDSYLKYLAVAGAGAALWVWQRRDLCCLEARVTVLEDALERSGATISDLRDTIRRMSSEFSANLGALDCFVTDFATSYTHRPSALRKTIEKGEPLAYVPILSRAGQKLLLAVALQDYLKGSGPKVLATLLAAGLDPEKPLGPPCGGRLLLDLCCASRAHAGRAQIILEDMSARGVHLDRGRASRLLAMASAEDVRALIKKLAQSNS